MMSWITCGSREYCHRRPVPVCMRSWRRLARYVLDMHGTGLIRPFRLVAVIPIPLGYDTILCGTIRCCTVLDGILRSTTTVPFA